MVKAVEIEIDGPRNECLHFRPLQRSVRGRFDLNRVAEPMARLKSAELPEPIPSMRLGIEPDGSAFLVEPLHDPEFAPIREKIEARGMKLEPATQRFENIDYATWIFWIMRAVESGLAKVVSGKLPDKINGKVQKNWVLNEPSPSPVDRLTAAIDRQSKLFEKLLEKLGDR